LSSDIEKAVRENEKETFELLGFVWKAFSSSAKKTAKSRIIISCVTYKSQGASSRVGNRGDF
jgi:hypothetical protein